MRRENEEMEEQEETSNEFSNHFLKEIADWVITIGIVFVSVFLIITFVGQRTQVSGHSMNPTLKDGDNLIVEKLSYRFHDPERYDIIVFPHVDLNTGKDSHFIKRIIGLPGETVQVKDGYVYINGMKSDETYGKELIQDEGIAASPIELGKDEYFVMGDNRNHSADSRDPRVGVITRRELTGKAWVRLWPLNKIKVLKHK